MFRSCAELFLSFRHSRRSWDPRETLLGRDRRLFERVGVKLPCQMNNRLFGLDTPGSLLNMSLGGAGLVAPVNWPEGSRIRFTVPDLRWDSEAVIVFRQEIEKSDLRECRYGVKFQRLGIRDVWRLRGILKNKHSGPLAVL